MPPKSKMLFGGIFILWGMAKIKGTFSVPFCSYSADVSAASSVTSRCGGRICGKNGLSVVYLAVAYVSYSQLNVGKFNIVIVCTVIACIGVSEIIAVAVK